MLEGGKEDAEESKGQQRRGPKVQGAGGVSYTRLVQRRQARSHVPASHGGHGQKGRQAVLVLDPVRTQTTLHEYYRSRRH